MGNHIRHLLQRRGIACDKSLSMDDVPFTTNIRLPDEGIGERGIVVTCPQCLEILKAWRHDRGL